MPPVGSAEVLEAEAANWLIRSESVGFTARDRVRLDDWLGSNPRHRATFVRLQTAWGRTEQFRKLRPLDGSVNAALLREVIPLSSRR